MNTPGMISSAALQRRAQQHAGAGTDAQPVPAQALAQAAAQAPDERLQQALDIIGTHSGLFRHDFAQWLRENWHVWLRFEREAEQVWQSGREHYSARTLIEFIRHETFVREKGEGSFKVNNSFCPDIGRLYGKMHPDRQDFFECRVMKQVTMRCTVRNGVLPADAGPPQDAA